MVASLGALSRLLLPHCRRETGPMINCDADNWSEQSQQQIGSLRDELERFENGIGALSGDQLFALLRCALDILR
jgi:hypothetical protein